MKNKHPRHSAFEIFLGKVSLALHLLEMDTDTNLDRQALDAEPDEGC